MSRRATRASQRRSLARGEERTRTRGVPLALTRHEERTRDMHELCHRTARARLTDTLLQPHRATARTFYSWRHDSEQRSGEEQLVPLLPTCSTLFRQKTYFLFPFPTLLSTNLTLFDVWAIRDSANLFKVRSSCFKVWNGDNEMESVKRRCPVLYAPCVNTNEVLRSILNAFVLVPCFWLEMYWLALRSELECALELHYHKYPPPLRTIIDMKHKLSFHILTRISSVVSLWE